MVLSAFGACDVGKIRVLVRGDASCEGVCMFVLRMGGAVFVVTLFAVAVF